EVEVGGGRARVGVPPQRDDVPAAHRGRRHGERRPGVGGGRADREGRGEEELGDHDSTVSRRARDVRWSPPVKRIGSAAVVAALAVAAAGCGGQAATRSTTTPRPAPEADAPALRGLVPTPLPHRPSFTLTDTSGRPFDFAERTRGKLTYLYFGYTHCPDACPTAMTDLAYAVHIQPASVRRRVAVVFVTVDPRRDTRHVLRTWLDHYDR